TVVDQILRQEVEQPDAIRRTRMTDLHQILQLRSSEVVKNNAGVGGRGLCARTIYCLTSAAQERRRTGLESRRNCDFPAFAQLSEDRIAGRRKAPAGAEWQFVNKVELDRVTNVPWRRSLVERAAAERRRLIEYARTRREHVRERLRPYIACLCQQSMRHTLHS